MIETQLKHRVQRCLELLNTIYAEKGVNRNTLAERYHCSTRTISKDIALLREIGFEITYTNGEYTLSVAEQQIPPRPSNREHFLTLFVVSQLLVFIPLEGKTSNVMHNMFPLLSDEEQGLLRNLTRRIYLDTPGRTLCCGFQLLAEVYRAVSECQSLRIHYFSTSAGAEVIRNVDPYGIYIKGLNGSYLVGRSYGDAPEIRRFKLRQIRKLIFRGLRFTYPENFSLQAEIAKDFRLGETVQYACIRYTPDVFQVISEREAPEHNTLQPDRSLLVRKPLKQIEEMVSEVLSYGAHAEVLEPEALRATVKDRIEQMRRVYE